MRGSERQICVASNVHGYCLADLPIINVVICFLFSLFYCYFTFLAFNEKEKKEYNVEKIIKTKCQLIQRN